MERTKEIEALYGYENRVGTLAGIFLIAEMSINKKAFYEFTSKEYFNLTMQILCFIMHRSLHNEKSFREDIDQYVWLLSREIYKKDITRETVTDLTHAILRKGLRNDGESYYFDYYNYEKNSQDQYVVTLIDNRRAEDEDGLEKTEYFLTETGYRLIFATKEYDDIYQIKISRIVTEMKITNGDYIGAQDDINRAISLLNLQSIKMDNYIQSAKQDIKFIKDEHYSDIILGVLDVIIDEIDKYKMLKETLKERIESIRNQEVDVEKITESIEQINLVLEGLDRVIAHIYKLHSKKGNFNKQYKELLKNILLYRTSEKFDFEKVVMARIEEDPSRLYGLQKYLGPLLQTEPKGVLSINHVYDYHISPKIIEKREKTARDEFDGDVEEQENQAERNHLYYIEVLTELINYAYTHNAFTLEEFLKHLKTDLDRYIKTTRDIWLLRDLLMYFGTLEENLDLEIIRKENLKNTRSIEPTNNVDIDYICERLDTGKELPIVGIKLLRKDLDILASIDKETGKAHKLSTPDMIFRVLERGIT